jgi:NADH:ubiquinone oxidoreductase subunit 5 (subunit L)/multisubunit Na+/H+ antiporter MnhA subunit
MGQFIIILSLIPILSVVLNNQLNGEKRLSYLPAIVIYLAILSALVFSNDINHFLIPFLTIENNQIDLLFNFKSDHTLMSKVVLLVSTLVLIYSSKFLESENLRSSNKYFLFITIFISSMFLFTLSNDLFILLSNRFLE